MFKGIALNANTPIKTTDNVIKLLKHTGFRELTKTFSNLAKLPLS